MNTDKPKIHKQRGVYRRKFKQIFEFESVAIRGPNFLLYSFFMASIN